MFSVRLISLWCALAVAGTVAQAQGVDFRSIPEDTRPLLTVFLGTDQRSMEFENELLQYEGLPGILSQVSFRKVTSADPIYQERWGNIIPTNRFPAVMLQDTDGGVVYLVSGQDMPPPKDMAVQMRSLWTAYTRAKSGARTQIPSNPLGWTDFENPDCPDGNCPAPNPNIRPVEPFGVPMEDTFERRPRPIVDTLTGAVWAVVLAIVGSGMLLLFMAVLIVVLLALTRKK